MEEVTKQTLKILQSQNSYLLNTKQVQTNTSKSFCQSQDDWAVKWHSYEKGHCWKYQAKYPSS